MGFVIETIFDLSRNENNEKNEHQVTAESKDKEDN